MAFFKEFKEFAMRGNVVDMAVGVIIGGAFGKIVSSLVNDIIMPPIGWLIGGMDFSQLKITLPASFLNPDAAQVTINYGNFIQVIIDFLIVALCIFLLIKGINKLTSLRKKAEKAEAEKAAAAPAPQEPSEDIKLLTEIRDLLKKENEKK